MVVLKCCLGCWFQSFIFISLQRIGERGCMPSWPLLQAPVFSNPPCLTMCKPMMMHNLQLCSSTDVRTVECLTHTRVIHKHLYCYQPCIQMVGTSLKASLTNAWQQMCFKLISAPHASDWLFALPIPISTCVLRLDGEAVTIAVGLHHGARSC